MNYIYFIIIAILIYLNYNTWQTEKFTVVGYNASYIAKNPLPNTFNIETLNLQSQLIKSSIDKDIDTKQYTLYNNNLFFPFKEKFKQLISEFLQKITNDKIVISDPTNIYWTDYNLDRTFIFNVNMSNTTNFISRILIIKIKVLNITQFFEPGTLNYTLNINQQAILNNTEILHVSLAKTNALQSSIQGIDSSNPTQYEIQNALHLLQPFYTSGYDMIITPTMQYDFDKSLTEHQIAFNNSINK